MLHSHANAVGTWLTKLSAMVSEFLTYMKWWSVNWLISYLPVCLPPVCKNGLSRWYFHHERHDSRIPPSDSVTSPSWFECTKVNQVSSPLEGRYYKYDIKRTAMSPLIKTAFPKALLSPQQISVLYEVSKHFLILVITLWQLWTKS